ncbi:hypothetical protein [Archaeoglobus sp.]
MSIICPRCKRPMNLVTSKDNTTIHQCDICKSKHITISENISVSDGLRIKVRDKRGKVVLESKIEDGVEKRFSRKPSKALQIVFKEGKIVHLHCKSEDCGNEWKITEKVPLNRKFTLTETQNGILEITCKKCGRRYYSG